MKKNTIIVSIIAILMTCIFGCIRIYQLNDEVGALIIEKKTLEYDMTIATEQIDALKKNYEGLKESHAIWEENCFDLTRENHELQAKVDALEKGRLDYRKQLTDILDASGVDRNWYPEYSDDEYVKEVAFNNMSNEYFGNK